jgi:hypothetical protein
VLGYVVAATTDRIHCGAKRCRRTTPMMTLIQESASDIGIALSRSKGSPDMSPVRSKWGVALTGGERRDRVPAQAMLGKPPAEL